MAIPPERLRAVVCGTFPALYFGLEAVEDLTRGAVWNGMGHGVMAGLVALAPFVSNPSTVKGWQAIIYIGLIAIGLMGWHGASRQIVRVSGFFLVVIVQLAASLISYRLPTSARQAINDEPVVLNLNGRSVG